ncbi:hypothetical protein BDW68DRAFT_160195 [Aspergillus falconensis]
MELINLSLSRGSNIDGGPARYGRATALQTTAIRGYLKIAQRLTDLNADIIAAPAETEGRTALEGAEEHGRIGILHMLLDSGASVTGDHGGSSY